VPHTPAEARRASLRRWRSPDDPERQAADREAREERLTRQINDLVDAWPPLTEEQRCRLALLLRGDS